MNAHDVQRAHKNIQNMIRYSKIKVNLYLNLFISFIKFRKTWWMIFDFLF